MDINDMRYDAQCKKILSDKEYTSRILKALAWEYKDISLQEIKDKYLPSDIRRSVGSILVMPDITGRDKKKKSGEVTFDVRFDCKLPDQIGKNIGVLVDIEGQKSTKNLSYDPVTRGIFYSGVMLASEYGSIVKNSHYEDLQKVYSIWVCMSADKKRKGSITRFKIVSENVKGEGKYDISDYDKVEVIVIELGTIEGEDETSYNINELMELLNYTFSDDGKAEEKVEGLKSRFGIDISQELKEDIGTMCNFSEVIEERGMEKGLEQGLEQGEYNANVKTAAKLLAKGTMSIEEISEVTDLTIDQVRRIAEERAS